MSSDQSVILTQIAHSNNFVMWLPGGQPNLNGHKISNLQYCSCASWLPCWNQYYWLQELHQSTKVMNSCATARGCAVQNGRNFDLSKQAFFAKQSPCWRGGLPRRKNAASQWQVVRFSADPIYFEELCLHCSRHVPATQHKWLKTAIWRWKRPHKASKSLIVRLRNIFFAADV